jgi:hypothetical protein
MTELQENIVNLRKEGLSYGTIQLALGNPSKKIIKNTLREFAPELAGDTVKNYHRLEPTW